MPPQNNPPAAASNDITPDGVVIEQTASNTEQPVVTPSTETSTETVTPTTTEQTTPDEKIVDLSDFMNVKGEATPEVEKPEVVKATPADTTTVKPPTKTVTFEAKVPAPKTVEERDISDLDPDIAPAFKKMSNEAFNTLKPAFKNLKQSLSERDAKIAELEKGIVKLPENYYEHPQAVVLTPEFAEMSNDVTQARLVLQHWEKQLNDVRGGSADFDFLYQDEQGKWATRKLPADNTAETKLFSYFNFAQNQQMQIQSKLDTFVQNHQSKVREYSTWAKNFEIAAFPYFEKPENKQKFDPIIQDTIKQFPAVYQKSPLANILAKSLVVNQRMAAYWRNLQQNGGNTQQATNSISQQKAKAGPNAGEIGTSQAANNGSPEVTVDDFEKVKAGY